MSWQISLRDFILYFLVILRKCSAYLDIFHRKTFFIYWHIQCRIASCVLWYFSVECCDLHILARFTIRCFWIIVHFKGEERRLRAFENRVLRRVFGPKRDEVTGEWRKLHNEQLSDLYS